MRYSVYYTILVPNDSFLYAGSAIYEFCLIRAFHDAINGEDTGRGLEAVCAPQHPRHSGA